MERCKDACRTLSFMFIMVAVVRGDEVSCHSKDPFSGVLFGFETAYDVVRGNFESPETVPTGCHALAVWHLVRHGVHLPDAGTLNSLNSVIPELHKEIVEQLEAGRGTLCSEDVAIITSWKPSLPEKPANLLTSQGEQDVLKLAQRVKSHASEIVAGNATTFVIRYPNNLRSSAEWYMKGLWGVNASVPASQGPPSDMDRILNFQGVCPFWTDSVLNNKKTMSPLKSFEEDSEFLTVLDNISHRLGLQRNLSIAEVNLMWDMCRFESLWKRNHTSPWCFVFSKEDLNVMLFRTNLRSYLSYGHRHPVTLKLGCPLVTNLLIRFSQVESDPDRPALFLFFSGPEALLLTLTEFGIIRNEKELGDGNINFSEMVTGKWNISNLSPFSANVAAVFFKCVSDQSYYVRMFLNENPVTTEACPSQDMCPWTDFRDHFAPVVESCDMKFCNEAISPIKSSLFLSVFFLLISKVTNTIILCRT